MDRIPQRCQIEHAPTFFHVGADFELLKKLADRLIILEAEQSLRMFACERYMKAAANHRAPELGDRRQGTGDTSEKPRTGHLHNSSSAKGCAGPASLGLGKALSSEAAIRRS